MSAAKRAPQNYHKFFFTFSNFGGKIPQVQFNYIQRIELGRQSLMEMDMS